MREWNLAPGDPLVLTLSGDFRLGRLDVENDQIWELELGGGDPSAISLRTTYGLRAKLMRIFPRFHMGDKVISNPGAFASQPILRRFAPNFLLVTFAPFQGIDVTAEYWIPDSHTVAGRFSVLNSNSEKSTFHLELCGQLVPMDGQPMATASIQSANVLAGRSTDLSPVVFLTGGPANGPGPYPSLIIDLVLDPGESRTLTWVQASLQNALESFDHARRTAARSWEAERSRLEMVNSAQSIDIYTGDPDWDAAFAFSQKLGFSLFLGNSSPDSPHPFAVHSRGPDQGYLPGYAGRDYSHLWNNQPTLETLFLANSLPGASQLISGLICDFLASEIVAGSGDSKPRQGGSWLAAPMMASLAWKYYRITENKEFLREIFSKLEFFLHQWFSPLHDRDNDGFPEWDHPLQSALEDHPIYSIWQDGSQGADISCAETPALAAMLYHDFMFLAKIARTIDLSARTDEIERVVDRLGTLLEECWSPVAALYHSRDRDSHHSPEGNSLANQNGTGSFPVSQSFDQPVRVLIDIQGKGESISHPVITIQGHHFQEEKNEIFERKDFQWHSQRGVATSRALFTGITSLQVAGLEKRDSVSLQVMDFSREDVSLFLPLWAGIPSADQARAMIERSLFSEDRFGRKFGIPCSPGMDQSFEVVHIPWNVLIGEGLLQYGFRQEAALLTSRLMSAVVENLKKHHAFYRSYHAMTGAGLGDRNSLQGIAPLGLFLKTLGVEILSPKRVNLSGKNPFPWPVTVKYRGLTVIRHLERTEVVFPDGQAVTLDDSTDAEVTVE